MLGPNQHTFSLATSAHEERANHAARIHAMKRERKEREQVTTHTHRMLTVRRLAAAGIAGVVLAAALAAGGAGGASAASNPAAGGGPTLIR